MACRVHLASLRLRVQRLGSSEELDRRILWVFEMIARSEMELESIADTPRQCKGVWVRLYSNDDGKTSSRRVLVWEDGSLATECDRDTISIGRLITKGQQRNWSTFAWYFVVADGGIAVFVDGLLIPEELLHHRCISVDLLVGGLEVGDDVSPVEGALCVPSYIGWCCLTNEGFWVDINERVLTEEKIPVVKYNSTPRSDLELVNKGFGQTGR